MTWHTTLVAWKINQFVCTAYTFQNDCKARIQQWL